MGTTTDQTETIWDDTPVSPAVQAIAVQAVRDFHECFWWWNENFIPMNRGDVREIITQLRKSGPRKAWERAQGLQIEMSDLAETEITRIADTLPDLPIGVAFVDREGRPGWIGNDPALRLHAPSVRGCLPLLSEG